MNTQPKNTYARVEVDIWPIPNHWDIIALVLVMALICLMAWGVKAMAGQYHLGQVLPISLGVSHLP